MVSIKQLKRLRVRHNVRAFRGGRSLRMKGVPMRSLRMEGVRSAYGRGHERSLPTVSVQGMRQPEKAFGLKTR